MGGTDAMSSLLRRQRLRGSSGGRVWWKLHFSAPRCVCVQESQAWRDPFRRHLSYARGTPAALCRWHSGACTPAHHLCLYGACAPLGSV